MAIPWQTDFLLCADHWWPSQRPDDVVTEGVIDEDINKRKKWAETQTTKSFQILWIW